MCITKPLLLIATPIGVVGGLVQAWRLASGLVFLMLAIVSVIHMAVTNVVLTVRRERRQADASHKS